MSDGSPEQEDRDQAEKDLADAISRTLIAETTQRNRLDTLASFIVTSTGGIVALIGAATAILPAIDAPIDAAGSAAYIVAVGVGLLLAAVLVATFGLVRWGRGGQLDQDVFQEVADGVVLSHRSALNRLMEHEARLALRQRDLNHRRGITFAIAATIQMLGVAFLAGGVVALLLDIAS